MGKADDSRRTKKYPQKSGIRNLTKATNENSKSYKQATTQAKKTSDVKEMMTPYQKTKQTTFIVSFIMILASFLWILEKNKQNASNFIV